MPISFDFLIQFFAFSAGAGIVLVYVYWHSVRPDPRLRWAIWVLGCVVVNYLLGLYAYVLEDDLIIDPGSYLHFAAQSLTLMGLLLGLHRLLQLLGAQTPVWLSTSTWVSLISMATLIMVARALATPWLFALSSGFFVLTGCLLLAQFWRFQPASPSAQRIRRLAMTGLAILLPAFVLQSLLPERWPPVHPVDALAYLYVMGSALWIALNGMWQNANNVQPVDEILPLSAAQQHFDLTEREFQVLRLLVQAKPYKTIADELSISAHTVKTHASNLYRKTGIQRKSELKHRFSGD